VGDKEYAGNEYLMLDPEPVAMFNRIVKATGAKIVARAWRQDRHVARRPPGGHEVRSDR
jgi:hypothetical protein